MVLFMKREYMSPEYQMENEINDVILISTQVDENGSFIGIVDIEDILG